MISSVRTSSAAPAPEKRLKRFLAVLFRSLSVWAV
jgi:hypothetical protein